jgi:hypothetical protein
MRSNWPQSLLRSLSLIAVVAGLTAVAAEEAAAARYGDRHYTPPRVVPRMHTPRVYTPRVMIKAVKPTYVKTYPKVHTPRYPGKVVISVPPGRPPGAHTPPYRPPYHPPMGPRRPGGMGPGPIVMGAVPPIIIGSLVPAGASPPPPPSFGPRGPRGAGVNIPPAGENRFVSNEVVLEFPGTLDAAAIGDLASRHRLAPIETLRFTLTGSTFFRARITDGRPVRDVLRGLNGEPMLREGVLLAGQPNYIYRNLQHDGRSPKPDVGMRFSPPAAGTPAPTPAAAVAAGLPPAAMETAQYAVAKLRLPEAHGLARGTNVLVAVIDSGVDTAHPELAGVIAGTFDALGTPEKPHFHGTAIAGAIASHTMLKGVAPAARILALHAFSATGATAEATTMGVLKSIEYATIQNARVVNMSFAGPSDPGLSRHLSLAHGKGMVLIAAAGNFGPKSPPQYPAADPKVIAVTATDADDQLFKASNIGGHITIAAPGVDILLPQPEGGYDTRSGTSFAAAHVSGIAALILERRPDLSPDAVRRILISTAKDLGPPGRDPLYGAGLADAYRAILAIDSMPR